MSSDPITPEPAAVDARALAAQRGRMRRLARSLVRDEGEADDVVQEACLRALTGRVRPRLSVGACLGGVVRNVAARLARSEGRRAARERGAARGEGLPSTLDLLARVEEQERVLACVRRLAEPYRTAILLRYFEDLPPRVIAERTGTPIETVKSRLKRGLARLRVALDAEHGGRRTAWMAALAPVAGLDLVRTASALGTGGTIVTYATKTKIAAAAVVVLLAGGAGLLASGVLDGDDPSGTAPDLMTAGVGESAPGLVGAAPPPDLAGTPTRRAATDETHAPAPAPSPSAEVAPAASEDETGPRRKPAVHRSPFGLPVRRGTPLGGGGRLGPMGGPTGHWTRFGHGSKPRGEARLAVRVLDADGKGVVGAKVYLGPPDTAGQARISFGDLREIGSTSDGGRLEARDLPAGEAAVFANFHSRLLGRGGLDGRAGVTTTLRDGHAAEAVVTLPFALGSLGAVKGRVLGPDGNPLRGVSVASGYGRVFSRDGTYALEGLEAGPRRVSAQATGYRPQTIETTVPAGGTATVDFELAYAETGSARVAGRVLGPGGEPVAGANVYLMFEADRGTARHTRSDAEGRYVMDALPERVRTESVRLQAGRIPLYASRVLRFEEGIPDERVDVTLDVRYVQLRLEIVDADTGEPIRDLHVTATRPESRRQTVPVPYDYDEGYREGMVEPGRHRIAIDALDHEDMEIDLEVAPDADWRFRHRIELERVSPPSTQVALTIHLREAGTLEPITRAAIEVQETGTNAALSRFEASREGGFFRMPAPSGTRRLVIRAAGYREHTQALTLKPDVPEVELEVTLQPE